jgi:hypothetical protein
MATGANGEPLRLSGPQNPYPGKLGVVEEGARVALRQVAAQPLPGGRRTDPLRGSRRMGRDPMLDHVLHHFLSTREGESGILMGVHSAELLKGCGWVAPPSLSDSVRMDRNNVLKLHT